MMSGQLLETKPAPIVEKVALVKEVKVDVPETPVFSNGNADHVVSAPTPAQVVETAVEAAVSAGTDTTMLEKMLLEVVSEKTGYPAEMLELGMDMEADLGIDSIKRVEIFGAGE